jgi:hypothetical protein
MASPSQLHDQAMNPRRQLVSIHETSSGGKHNSPAIEVMNRAGEKTMFRWLDLYGEIFEIRLARRVQRKTKVASVA